MFVNYLSDVLPLTRKFSPPTCLHCGTPISWKDYILLQSCPNGHRRSFRNWTVLLAMIGLNLMIWLTPPSKIGYALGFFLLTYFGVVFVIDMEHRLILHPTSIVGSLLALITGIISHGVTRTLVGGLAGFLFMLVIYYFGVLFSRFRAGRMRSRGLETDDEEALGAGDVILTGVLGLAVGWPLIWFSILLTIMLAGIVGLLSLLYLVIIRKYRENALMVFMPYGPFLLLSAFAIIFLPNLVYLIVPK